MSIDTDSLSALAVFPLPNAVLLPGGVMPLHIFEPRYREMTRDCLEGSRAMAIAMLQPGFRSCAQTLPPVYPIVGVGTILASEELDDGRYHLALQGVSRARIEDELAPDRSYRRMRVTLVDASSTTRPEAMVAGHRQLLALCERFACAIGRGGHALCELAHAQPDPGACADAIAAALLSRPRDRQTMLETLDAADRVDAACDLLARYLCELACGEVN